MDNISKALEIAGGVLLAVIIMSLVSYFFSSIGIWPQIQDEVEDADQLAAFNMEYEVYEKKGMYGVDVISCLNKAKSNNEKYAEGGSFLTGNKYGQEFYIDVWVQINSPLEESLEIYFFDTSGQRRLTLPSSPNVTDVASKRVIKVNNDSKILTMKLAGFDSNNNYYTKFNIDDDIDINHLSNTLSESEYLIPTGGTHQYTTSDGVLRENYYSLLDNNGDNKLVDLLLFSNNGNNANGNLDRTVTNRTGKDLNKWAAITWKTALSDFKKKRFRCDFIGYNDRTGRVNAIYFSEL